MSALAWVAALALAPVLAGVGLGVALVLAVSHWKLVPSVTHLHVGEGQVLLAKLHKPVPGEALARIGAHLEQLLKARGVVLPVLMVGSGMSFQVVGDRVAASGQRRPA